jgi:hypothetical protein
MAVAPNLVAAAFGAEVLSVNHKYSYGFHPNLDHRPLMKQVRPEVSTMPIGDAQRNIFRASGSSVNSVLLSSNLHHAFSLFEEVVMD